MIKEVQNLLKEYKDWLHGQIELREIDGFVEISTPYLDRHNDYIQIYVRKENGRYILSDDGYILRDLSLSGCELNSEKRKQLFNSTINGFGVSLYNGHELVLTADEKNFPLKKHNLLQAMLAVNDMFFVAESHVKSLFYEDVERWLKEKEIRFTSKVKLAGKSGFDHNFDFIIPESKKQPERILKVISRPSRDTAESLILAWLDTKDTRDFTSKAYACLNDIDQPLTSEVDTALRNYNINPLLWSKRKEYEELLVA